MTSGCSQKAQVNNLEKIKVGRMAGQKKKGHLLSWQSAADRHV
jgi:hypothetical protein